MLLLALAPRLLYFGIALHAHGGDVVNTSRASDGYFAISQNILAGQGFSSDEHAPYTLNSFRPPLQPYFLAASASVFGSYWAPLALTILMGSLMPLIGMTIAAQWFTSRRLIIATGIVLALEPVSILFSILFYSETLFMLFFLPSFLYLLYYFKSKRLLHLLFSAFLLGFAMMTRPTVEYLPLLYMALIIWNSRHMISARVIGHACLYGAIFVLVISPWLYRNYREFGVVAITPQQGVNIYANLVPSVLSVANGTPFEQEYQKIVAEGAPAPNKTAIGQDTGSIGKALPILLAHPKALLVTMAITESAFFTHDGVLDMLKLAGFNPQGRLGKPAISLLFTDPAALGAYVAHYAATPAVLILLMRIFWIFVTLLFCVGIWRYLRRYGPTTAFLVGFGTLGYFAGITIIIGLTVNARYRVPVEFILIPFALYGGSGVLEWLRRKWRSHVIKPTGI